MAIHTALAKILDKYPGSLSPTQAHGFLTAMNIAPSSIYDLSWMQTLLGLPASVPDDEIPMSDRDVIFNVMDEIEDEMSEGELIPKTTESYVGNTKMPDTDQWAEGYLKVVAMNADDWQAVGEQVLSFAQNLLGMNVLADPTRFASLLFGEDVNPADEVFLKDLRAQAGPLAVSMYEHVLELVADDIFGADLDMEDVEDEGIALAVDELHQTLSADKLEQMEDDELYPLLFIHEDRLPLSVVNEIARRESTMLPKLAEYIEELDNWSDLDDSDFWPLLHHVFILGKMRSEQAARLLLIVLSQIDKEIYDDRWDWIDGYWPALFGAKSVSVRGKLEMMAVDPTQNNSRLYDVLSILLYAGSHYQPDLIEHDIDLTAAAIQSLPRNHELRYLLGTLLLDFPRERHNALMLELAKEQKSHPDENPNWFGEQDVEDASTVTHEPEWARFSNPWQFYNREEIIARQLRWMEDGFQDLLDSGELDDDNDDAWDFDDEDFWTPQLETYVRETPKVGRNDPCPCGSGKKYKKCCLH